ncbi:MAG TPA: hypothetical protein ENN51_02045 [candidate division WOR-3 bacterium]|uniref:Uncharacterized protein n=1 Tax=candidate division WOR-3 bacterium TaxID=2052148 RepID=A0A7V0T4L1_UNCW3|nr:hypothetical protein [candidate division WOR-3 bacterium]
MSGKVRTDGGLVRVFCRGAALAAFLFVLAGTGCEDGWETLLVTAQVTRTLGVPSNTASVLVGKVSIVNVFSDDWLETPDPGDSTFWQHDPLPGRVTPVGGAMVHVGNRAVGQRVPGVYFQAALDLEFKQRYELSIETPDGKNVTGQAWLPDSFAVVEPGQGASLHPDSVRVTWTRSDSARTYLVGVAPVDTLNPAQGWADGRSDTTCLVPRAAFEDTLGNLAPGAFYVTVTAVNGGWKKSTLDLILAGGNLSGAAGTFGCAVMPPPAFFEVRTPAP